MKKDKIFFSESGLTSTSANFMANLAKESYRKLESELENMVFYTTNAKLLGGSEQSLIREGTKSVSDVKEKLESIAQLKALIAWLREAIKAKDRLIMEGHQLTYSDLGIDVPEQPKLERFITEDDVVATWNVKKRNRYYYLEALCSTIGEFIHPDGGYAKDRADLHNVIHEPNYITGSGRDAIVYSRNPSLPVEEVEDTYMELQKTYRGYQSEINSLKYEISTAVQEDEAEKRSVFHKAIEEYANKMAVIDADLAERQKKAVLEASNLKILIPDSLRPIYDRLQELGKK